MKYRQLLLFPIFYALSCTTAVPAPVAPEKPPLEPGEVCDESNSSPLKLRFDPPSLVLAPGQSRPVRLIIEPDACLTAKATFKSDNSAIVAPPRDGVFDLRHATYDFVVRADDRAMGSTAIRAHMRRPKIGRAHV